jgi:hypothetical protein
MEKKIIALISLAVLSGITAYCQVTDAEASLRKHSADTIMGWNMGGVFTATIAQTSLTNWVAGGQNSLSVNGLFSGFANYKKGKSVWDNSLDLGYGLIKQGKNEKFRKTDDKIDLLSKYGRQAFGNFYYSALMNLKTQMSPGYNYPDDTTKISDLFAPAYLTLALGLDFKPDPYFSVFISPATGKFTFVTDRELSDQGAFGVKPGETSRSEFGSYIRAIYTRNDFKAEFLKNVSFTTKIDLFSNYSDHPQNIDVNWETLIAMKVNKYLSFNLNTQLIYDDNISVPSDRNNDGVITAGESVRSLVQFKEIFGAGLSCKF